MKPNFDLKGKLVLITGGAGILGKRMAEALSNYGARVAIVDLCGDAATKVSEEINNRNSHNLTKGFECDITNDALLRRLSSKISLEFGSVDILINNAAAKSPNFYEPFEKYSVADWDCVMDINVKGSMLCSQLFGSLMAERKCGSIINVLSIYGIIAPDQRIYKDSLYEGRPINTPAVYSVSKSALLGLTKYLAVYWAKDNVRVNAITPGGVYSGQNDTFVDHYSNRVPMNRMADADEMSGAVVFLSSDAASYITGHNLVVDGGLTIW